MTGRSIFQSTPPARGATRGHRPRCRRQQISIHAPCEGGDSLYRAVAVFSRISIHAPCEGGDGSTGGGTSGKSPISIHAPCEGGDAEIPVSFVRPSISIHAPCEGGDRPPAGSAAHNRHFNPRPLRGGRRRSFSSALTLALFQSTPPARGATAKMHSFTCGSLTNK